MARFARRTRAIPLPALFAALALTACGGAPARPSDAEARALYREDSVGNPRRLARILPGEADYGVPYLPAQVLSDYWDCRPGRRQHRGIDFAGVGPLAGLGTPVFSIGRARVTHVARPEDDPERYGCRLTDCNTVVRGGQTLPTALEVADYGEVWFFTRDYGSAHTGVLVETELLDGPLAGHRVRYMHLGEVHPSVHTGVILERGQELGTMGGSAILESTPHVHLDIETPDGGRVDPAPYLGIETRDGSDASACR